MLTRKLFGVLNKMDVSSDEEAALFHDYEQLEHLHKNRLIEMIEVQKRIIKFAKQEAADKEEENKKFKTALNNLAAYEHVPPHIITKALDNDYDFAPSLGREGCDTDVWVMDSPPLEPLSTTLPAAPKSPPPAKRFKRLGGSASLDVTSESGEAASSPAVPEDSLAADSQDVAK